MGCVGEQVPLTLTLTVQSLRYNHWKCTTENSMSVMPDFIEGIAYIQQAGYYQQMPLCGVRELGDYPDLLKSSQSGVQGGIQTTNQKQAKFGPA